LDSSGVREEEKVMIFSSAKSARLGVMRVLLALAVSVLCTSTVGNAKTAASMIQPEELAPACKPVDGMFPTDLQTRILYDYQAYKGFLPPTEDKQYQSFDCEGQKGTVFYFVYADEQARKRVSAFVQPLLWGESGPSERHPELILEGGTSIVVVSFRKAPASLLAALQRKLSPADGGAQVVKDSPAAKEVEQGAAAYRARDLAAAERHFHSATELDPSNLFGFMYLGNALFYQQRYQEAIAPYERARQLDTSSKTLTEDFRRVLTDQLGMSYGMSGNLQKAKATFEDGIRQDPDYALFHYNLACAYAEMGDLDKTLLALKDALQRRDNVLKGESFPDPREDSSFQRYLLNDRFRQLLKQYGY